VRSYDWPPRKIFISRASTDAGFADALSSYLSSAGLRVLLERDFPTNRTVESAIEDAVLQSDLFIALWSRSYAASRFCFDEIDLALRRYQGRELQLWIVNIDGSDVVPPAARSLPQAVARTPQALVEVVKDLLNPHFDGGA
jgi:hypothetical protein